MRRIGDVILTTPALAALKGRYPQAAIDFLVEPPCDEVLAGNPHVRDVLVYRSCDLADSLSWITRIRQTRYDWVIDFMGNPRSAIMTGFSGAALRAGPAHVWHRWAYNRRLAQSSTTHYAGLEKIRVLKSLGVEETENYMPKLYFSPAPSAPENRIGLVPASRRSTRQWPAGSYARLGRQLREKFQSEICVYWGPRERELAQEVADGIGEGAVLSPETSDLRSLAASLSRCRLVVTNCNGPKHLAVALGVPTVTIHGSSDPVSWNPPHPRHLVVREETLFCIGCGLNACPYHLECMTQLPPEKVFAAAARLLL